MKKIPLHSLVLMVGPSGAGKSTIVEEHFTDYEVISSDAIRHELVGEFQRQDVNQTVFQELFRRTRLKLELGERVIVDATNLRRQDRMAIVEIGTEINVPIFYVVVNRPLEEKLKTAGWREDVPGLIERHDKLFLDNERDILRGDGFATVIDTRKEEFRTIGKLPLGDIGPHVLDLGFKGVMALGDVHGMRESLRSAMEWATARNLFMVFLGDIIDYGPNSLECVDLVHDVIIRGRGAMTLGNHEKKIERWLGQDRKGEVKLKLSDGNRATTRLVQALGSLERTRFENKFYSLLNLSKNHILLGDIMFTHGGAEPEMFKTTVSRLHGRLESIALYGEVDPVNKFNADGYPNRIYEWVNRIPQGKQVIVGHDIRSTVKPLVVSGAKGGEAIFLDTGSGKGGQLSTAHIIHSDGRWKVEAFSTH